MTKHEKDKAAIKNMLDVIKGFGYTENDVRWAFDLGWGKDAFRPRPGLKALLGLACMYPELIRHYDKAMNALENGKKPDPAHDRLGRRRVAEVIKAQRAPDEEMVTMIGAVKNPTALRVVEARLNGKMKRGESLFHKLLKGEEA